MSDMGVMEEIAHALRNSMSPGDRLASWTFRWAVQGGQVVCTQCQAYQSATQPCAAFVHRPGCCARRDEYPWRELAALLGRLPGH
ncbi:hypothetical protein [Pseudomonas eucalypticola]|uniref:Uncharacterized protein n=1 Tax=Pseudomonas eucalypticola TaxID=2599595 RepID=A0A7D5HPE4_9PSED|nr:hypothetical protein [Pseudomonas eucalypticola]QKZ05248.1 hypothetical protein HWQ56_16215 [Pseudomonas eucalypticola]